MKNKHVSVLFASVLLTLVFTPSAYSELNDAHPLEEKRLDQIDLFNEEAIKLLNKLDPFVPVPYPITNWCYAWLHQFAVKASDFIECSVHHARPFRFCRNCLKEFLQAHNFIQDLLAQDEKIEQVEKRCFPRLVNSDIINIVGKVRDFMEDVWRDSSCDHCFDHYKFDNGTIDAELTNMTKQYIAQYNVTDNCISGYIFYDNATKRYDQFACVQCLKDYATLNTIYAEMKIKGSVCMDVADAMNYTRYLWSKDFQCNRSDPNEAVVYGTCAAIFTLPLFFYLISKFQGSVRKRKLMKMKRLNLKRGASHARLLQSASLVYSDQAHTRRTSTVDEVNARRLNITPTVDSDNDPEEVRSSPSLRR